MFIFNIACKEFESRVNNIGNMKGHKTEIVRTMIDNKNAPFTVSQLQVDCPTISIDMIRLVLKQLKSEGVVECLGRGQKAQWQKTDKWELGSQ